MNSLTGDCLQIEGAKKPIIKIRKIVNLGQVVLAKMLKRALVQN